jgi:hypothetical protein
MNLAAMENACQRARAVLLSPSPAPDHNIQSSLVVEPFVVCRPRSLWILQLEVELLEHIWDYFVNLAQRNLHVSLVCGRGLAIK